jgi:hypothetical protein
MCGYVWLSQGCWTREQECMAVVVSYSYMSRHGIHGSPSCQEDLCWWLTTICLCTRQRGCQKQCLSLERCLVQWHNAFMQRCFHAEAMEWIALLCNFPSHILSFEHGGEAIFSS